MLDSIADFGLGDSITGQNADSVDINTSLDGREYTFPVTEDVAAAANFSTRTVGKRIKARIVRNKTGAAILPGEVVTVDFDGGHAGVGTADAKSSADDRMAYIVDPALPAAGCADNDLCYVILGGPSKVKQPASAATLTAGDIIKAGASGRLAESSTPGSEAHLLLGTVLEDNSVNDALVECVVHPAWE